MYDYMAELNGPGGTLDVVFASSMAALQQEIAENLVPIMEPGDRLTITHQKRTQQ